MEVNKVVLGEDTLIDLTSDTVTENDVLEGVTFHSADGSIKQGTVTCDSIPLRSNEYLYSENEVIVGCYTDGRPVYRRVYKTNNLSIKPSQSGQRYISAFTPLSGVTYLDVSGTLTIKSGNDSYYYPINSTTMGTAKEMTMTIYVNGNAVVMATGYAGYSVIGCDLIIEYTKTTDAPNSFTIDMLYVTQEDTVSDADVSEVFS